MDESSEKKHEADFTRRVFCYLENNLPADELARLSAELSTDPLKARLFVRLATVRRGTIEVLRNRAQSVQELDGRDDPVRSQLSETMVVPALMLPDEPEQSETMVVPALMLPDEPEQIYPPGPRSILPVNHSPAKPWWDSNLARAAALVLPILGGFVAWQYRYSAIATHPTVAQSNPPAIPDVPQPAPPNAPLYAPLNAPPNAPLNAPPNAPPVLARLRYTLNAQWDHTGADFPPSSALTDGPHSLDNGIAQINLSGGAAVVLQAPAEFEVVSESRLHLVSGQVSAKVPHGSKGLTIQGPDLEVVDLGTEFGMNVVPLRQTHVEVFTGQVRADLSQGAAGSKIINADQAVAVKAGSSVMQKDVPAPLGFVRSEELEKRAESGGNFALPRWRAFSEVLRRDPDLIGYYTFENKGPMLVNQAVVTAGKHDGTLGIASILGSAPQWSQGRWPGKGALQFGDGMGSAVMIHADGGLIPTSNASIAFWVKRAEPVFPVHLLNRESDGHGTFNLSLLGTAGKNQKLKPNAIYFNYGQGTEISMVQLLPTDDQWLFIAVTVDPDHMTRFYVNGKRVDQKLISIPTDLNGSGDLCVGRSSPGNIEAASQDIFRGWMDELAIFHRTLSDNEILRMYDAGQPQ